VKSRLGSVGPAAAWAVWGLLGVGCAETFTAPDFTDRRTVASEEACSRYERALRDKCGGSVTFDCAAYLDEDCRGRQRETDVARCERLIRQSRTCDEALGQTCGQSCDSDVWPPRF
jgi:hypothetical protein